MSKNITSKFNWKIEEVKVNELEDMNILSTIPDLLYPNSKFYFSYYICPCCNNRILYKTKVNGNFSVLYNNRTKIPVINVFTCAPCRAFFAPDVLSTLTSGEIFKISDLSETDYMTLLNDIESVGNY